MQILDSYVHAHVRKHYKVLTFKSIYVLMIMRACMYMHMHFRWRIYSVSYPFSAHPCLLMFVSDVRIIAIYYRLSRIEEI